MYQDGDGVPADAIHGEMYLDLSAARGNVAAIAGQARSMPTR